MSPEYLLGIDAGTSKIKAVLFTVHGHEVDKFSIDNQVIQRYEKYSEQDMNVLWENTSKAIKGLLKKVEINKRDILAIGLSGQGEGCWLINGEGKPVDHAILWSDGRSREEVAITKNENQYKKIKKITGSYPFPGATTMILKWLKNNEPKKLKEAKYCLYCKDWLRYKLTGNIYLEMTDASTSILDLRTKQIASEVFEDLGIGETLDFFPDLIKPTDCAGFVTAKAAAETGLPEGIPVSGGFFDIVSTAIGTGTVKPQDCCTILGTTCGNQVVRENYEHQGKDSSGFEIHGVENTYLNVIATMAGTPNLDWFINNFCQEDIQEAKKEGTSIYTCLEEKIKKIPLGCQGIIYHPYISPVGERAPFYDPNARAQFIGLSTNTSKYHMLRAVYEGVTYSIRDCLEGTHENGKIYLGGGGQSLNFGPK